jgi:hypothetical protein
MSNSINHDFRKSPQIDAIARRASTGNKEIKRLEKSSKT